MSVIKDYPFVKCLDPQRIVNPYTKETLVVPCGHCKACEQNKSSRYVFQLSCEMAVHKYNWFVTLTFANRFIPRATAVYSPFQVEDASLPSYVLVDWKSGEILGRFDYPSDLLESLVLKCNLYGYIPYLDKSYAQNFIKRLRERLRLLGFSVRFFLSGEYSPKTFRPHFHLILSSDNPELCSIRGTLGEFPEWTWSRDDQRIFTKETPVSLLEWHIRKSWPFGITDVQEVQSGNASKYVSGYVNGSCSLPSCFKISSTRCFCTHSQHLGQQIFRKELLEIFNSPVDQLVSSGLFLNGSYCEIDLPRNYYGSVFPRCQMYTHRTDASLFRYYGLFRKLGGSRERSCWQLAKEIGKDLMNVYYYSLPSLVNPVYKPFLSEILPYETFTSYVKKYSDGSSSVALLSACILHAYRFLAPSAVVCNNVDYLLSYFCRFSRPAYRSWTSLYKIYVSKLIDFHSKVDLNNLGKWYDSLSKWSLLDVLGDDGWIYFYNNTEYDFEEFKENCVYRSFASNVERISEEHVKHKKQNDLNKIFEVYE